VPGADLYVRDRVGGTTVIASVSSAGEVPTTYGTVFGAISGDGRHVAFLNKSHELVPGDTNASSDVFVRDLDTGITERVSLSSAGLELDIGVEAGERPAIDFDGSVVAFVSQATSVVADGGTGKGVFVRDRASSTTYRASKTTAGVPANGDSSSPTLSDDGSVVAYVSSATNLIPNDTNNHADVFVHTAATGNTYRSPTVSAPALSVAISANGRYLATRFDTQTDACIVTDRIAGTSRNVSLDPDGGPPENATVGRCSISADGRYASYVSNGSDLGEDPHATGPHVFVAPVVW
jgi:Tol biopolymer transport system component